jgi:hypothetical protein
LEYETLRENLEVLGPFVLYFVVHEDAISSQMMHRLSESALKPDLESAGVVEYAPEGISDDHDSQCEAADGSTKPECRSSSTGACNHCNEEVFFAIH